MISFKNIYTFILSVRLFLCLSLSVCLSECIHIYIYLCVRACVRACVLARLHARVPICLPAFLYVCLSVCLYVCLVSLLCVVPITTLIMAWLQVWEKGECSLQDLPHGQVRMENASKDFLPIESPIMLSLTSQRIAAQAKKSRIIGPHSN